MKQGSTLFLKGVVIVIGLAVLITCLAVLPVAIRSEDAAGYRPILVGMYFSSILFFLGLYQAWNLLSYIDKNNAFSDLSVKALNKIKYYALAISAMFALGMPYIYHVADKDDAPGVVAIALVIIFASFVLGIFAEVLKRVFQNALEIKSENDLMV